MAKGSRGGQRGTTSASVTQQILQQMQQQPQVDNTQQVEALSKSWQDFVNATDDEKADIILNAIQDDVPNHLQNSDGNYDYQKFIYNLDMNDKPTVVDDTTLDNMNGTEIFRTVNYVDRQRNSKDIGYTAPQILAQLRYGNITRVSAGGRAYYGSGIYFADTKGDSAMYGNTYGKVKSTAMVRGKLNANAKIISQDRLDRAMDNEMNSGSKLGNAIKQIARSGSGYGGYRSAESIYAVSKGYNVIRSAGGYYNILNRGAVTLSDTDMSI